MVLKIQWEFFSWNSILICIRLQYKSRIKIVFYQSFVLIEWYKCPISSYKDHKHFWTKLSCISFDSPPFQHKRVSLCVLIVIQYVYTVVVIKWIRSLSNNIHTNVWVWWIGVIHHVIIHRNPSYVCMYGIQVLRSPTHMHKQELRTEYNATVSQ